MQATSCSLTLVTALGMDCSATASLVNLVAIFKRYASRDEDKDDLSKSELKELLLNEFPMLVDVSQPLLLMEAQPRASGKRSNGRQRVLAGRQGVGSSGHVGVSTSSPASHSILAVFQEGAKPDDINQILDDLDQNGDGRVDITEYFVILVAVGVVLFELSKDTEQM